MHNPEKPTHAYVSDATTRTIYYTRFSARTMLLDVPQTSYCMMYIYSLKQFKANNPTWKFIKADKKG